MSKNSFNLERFITAQSSCNNTVVQELKAGRNRSHWIWFVFPQLKGLGNSYNANYYGIDSLEEAQSYLDHPLLGARIIECTSLLLDINGKGISDILGYPDDLKLKSSMTLFAALLNANPVFNEV